MTFVHTLNTLKLTALGFGLAFTLVACNSGSNDTVNATGGTVTASETGGAGTITPSQVAQNTTEPMKNIGHVFVIVLENKNFSQTFGADSPAPYLAKDLVKMGAFVPNYYGVAHNSNPNYLAMISGQGPNIQTQADCQIYSDFIGNPTAVDPNGQALGQGCVYPSFVKTLANQLQDKGLNWKGYMEDMGKDPTREAATCGHPAINSRDNTQSATATDQYAARHNPFVYFHSIIDDQQNCDQRVVALDKLQGDLASASTTANYNMIVPNLCNDGHDTGCANGDAGGLVSINDFLKRVVPMILNSPAYKQDGLLIVTFDEAELQSTPTAPSASTFTTIASDLQNQDLQGALNQLPILDKAGACCASTPNVSLNSPLPGILGFGGGQVGAVMLSPFIKPGTVSNVAYNHYAMLKSIENGFGLDYLGFAAQPALVTFGVDVFTNLNQTND